MRRSIVLATSLVMAASLAAACTDDGDKGTEPILVTTTTTTTTTMPRTSSTTSTTLAPVPTTTAGPSASAVPVGRCAEPAGDLQAVSGSPGEMPDDADMECDATAGWRFFFWVGESGDPIYRLQMLSNAGWVEKGYDVACDVSPAMLAAAGVPEALAITWGDKYAGQCG